MRSNFAVFDICWRQTSSEGDFLFRHTCHHNLIRIAHSCKQRYRYVQAATILYHRKSWHQVSCTILFMAKFYDEIPESLIEWIKKQHMFWVASAPLSPDGHVNLSPKGTADSFHVVNSRRVWYQDLTGSGEYHRPIFALVNSELCE